MKLTKKEREWVSRLQAVLDECPSDRLGFYTTGDLMVSIYDRRKDDRITDIQDRSNADFCNAVRDAGASFDEWIDFPSPVHSTSG